MYLDMEFWKIWIHWRENFNLYLLGNVITLTLPEQYILYKCFQVQDLSWSTSLCLKTGSKVPILRWRTQDGRIFNDLPKVTFSWVTVLQLDPKSPHARRCSFHQTEPLSASSSVSSSPWLKDSWLAYFVNCPYPWCRDKYFWSGEISWNENFIMQYFAKDLCCAEMLR